MRSRLTSGSFMTFLSPTVRSSHAGQSFFTVLTSCSTVPVTKKRRILGVPPLAAPRKS